MLDADQREFIKTGLTPEDWFMLFGDDSEIEGLVTNA